MTQLPPGNTGLPLIGETLRFLRGNEFLINRYSEHGPIFKTHIFGRPTIVMAGPEANRFLLSSGMKHFSWREGWPYMFRVLLGQSLFLMDGEEHRIKRKLLMPAFHREALHRYLEIMERVTLEYLHKWAEKGTFAWFEENKQLTFEIASLLLTGADPDEDTAHLSQQFTYLTKGLLSLPIPLPWTTFGKALKARDIIMDFIERGVKKRMENPTDDALSLLIQSRDEDGNALTLEELKAQAMLLLFAGHETTTSMITSFCYLMATQPEIRAKAEAEQAALNLGEQLTMDDIRNMAYLEQILKEVERVYPPVPSGFRGVVEAFEFNGYTVPKGWQAMYLIPSTHRDGSIWQEPETFNPERFSEGQSTQPFSLVGFGAGPRVCLGYSFAQLEMKIIASYLLRHFDWELLPDQDLSMSNIPTLHPKGGLQVRFWRK